MPALEETQDVYCHSCGYEYEAETEEDLARCPSCDCCPCEECAIQAAREEEEEENGEDNGERETVLVSETLVRPMASTVGALYLPNIPGRTIRPMSFEQEVNEGANEAAYELYDGGFAPDRTVRGYGSSGYMRSEHTGAASGGTFVHVEDDSSCGGEIIYSRLDLSDDSQARRMEQAFGMVRSLHASGDVVLTMACGFHIHIGIQGYGMRAIENLYHAHNYLEDVLYRLGAASWSSHRSDRGSCYAPTVAKGLAGKASIGRWMEGARAGLNLSNFMEARAHCHCGAFAFADWESCSCDLPKATVEFRWPNATANVRKVHAYAALLQALVSLCADSDDGAFAHLEPHTYEGAGRGDRYYWEQAAEWMATNLALTSGEADSIAYCFEKAPFNGYGEVLAGTFRGVTV